MENLYEVYALLNANKCIIGIESSAFHVKEELIEKGYIKIDEGSEGDTYGHAQGNYLINVFGKPMYDEQMKCNYKYVDGDVIDVTDEEKIAFYPPVVQKPTDSEKFDSRLTYLEIMTGVA